MKTVSVNVMNLCVPCENRCRHCLLSYDGKSNGVDFLRSTRYASHFHEWIQANRPDLSFLFGFGYSMEHPNLLEAIDFCNSIGSPTGEFLQLDGMRFRSKNELLTLLSNIQQHGVNLIDLTFYGTEIYHDRFAGRKGDYRLMMDTLETANQIGLNVKVSIPLTRENCSQLHELLKDLQKHKLLRIICFVPHSEGRGQTLNPIRLREQDYSMLDDSSKKYLNRDIFKTEAEWLTGNATPVYKKRVLTVTLTKKNIDFFENLPFVQTSRKN